MSGLNTTPSTTTEKKGTTMTSNTTPETVSMLHLSETTGGPTAT